MTDLRERITFGRGRNIRSRTIRFDVDPRRLRAGTAPPALTATLIRADGTRRDAPEPVIRPGRHGVAVCRAGQNPSLDTEFYLLISCYR